MSLGGVKAYYACNLVRFIMANPPKTYTALGAISWLKPPDNAAHLYKKVMNSGVFVVDANGFVHLSPVAAALI